MTSINSIHNTTLDNGRYHTRRTTTNETSQSGNETSQTLMIDDVSHEKIFFFCSIVNTPTRP